MDRFTSGLYTLWLPKKSWRDKQRWQVTQSFIFYMGDPDINGIEHNLYCKVEKGFITDLASIPWPLRWLVPKVGADAQGAVVHDRIYRDGYMWINENGTERQVTVNRRTVDKAYRIAMTVLKTVPVRREAIYRGLVAGGWYTWNKYRKA